MPPHDRRTPIGNRTVLIRPKSERRADHGAWRRFLGALGGLALAFFLALYATSLREEGRYAAAGALAAVSLLLAGVVAATVVPYLARRTALRRWMVKIEYEFTRQGLVYLLVIAAVAVAALNTGNNLLFIILACLLAGIVASGILSRLVLSDVGLELALPEHIFAAQPVEARLALQNRKRWFPSFSIAALTPNPPKPKRGGTGASAVEPKHRGAILDRPVYFPFIPRRARVTERVELRFPRRGLYRQEGFRISTRFPFGLLRKSRRAEAAHEIIVLPDVRPAAQLYEILPAIAGEIESYLKGRGHDLYAIRDYQETDTARHVDWKATAKAQQLKVREFTREDDRRVVLAFDARLRHAGPEALEQFEKAVTLAACLAWHFAESSVEVEFLTQGLERPLTADPTVYP